jgi:hypothetical protein
MLSDTLFRNLVKTIVVNDPEELLDNLTSFPIMFESLKGSVNDYETPKITYNEFLKELKTECTAIGFNPVFVVTHSLRRGSASDQFANKVPDKIIKYSGRWRSNDFETYIDYTVLFELQLETIQPPK